MDHGHLGGSSQGYYLRLSEHIILMLQGMVGPLGLGHALFLCPVGMLKVT